MKRKIPLCLTVVFLTFGLTLSLLKVHAIEEEVKNLESYTFFPYDESLLEPLTFLNSPSIITEQMLQDEDDFVEKVLISHDALFLEKLRLRTYLYTAQRDFAFLSYSIKHHFEGDLHPLTEQILKLFYPQYQISRRQTDPLTQKLTNLVFAKIAKRYSQEGKIEGNFPTHSWMPWVAKPSTQYFPAHFDQKKMLEQVKQVKEIQERSSPIEKEDALFWVGGCGIDTGDWLSIGNEFIFDDEKNIPLGKMILIRNLLSMTLYDTEIASHAAKAHFNVERPYDVDKTIKVLGPKPNSPSFPSGHAALAGSAFTILTHFFPEETEKLKEHYEDATYSRLVAGVHTPLDVEEGEKMGKKIALEILFNEWSSKEREASQLQSQIKNKYTRVAGGKFTPRPQCCSRKVIWKTVP